MSVGPPTPTPLLSAPPSDDYSPTGAVAWFVGNYEDERVLAMLFESPQADDPDVWVVVPEFKNPNA